MKSDNNNLTPPILRDDEENDDDDGELTRSVTIAVPPPIIDAVPDSSAIGEGKQPGDDRKLFQRLWTDEDEIGLLQGFLEYCTQRGTSQNNPHDTALFYDQIKSKLQLDFNRNQLVEKLRRLKKKYRNVLSRISSSGKEISFKNPHDQATFEIACKIWGTAHTSKDHLQVPQQQHQQRPNFNPASTNLNLNFATSFNREKTEDQIGVASSSHEEKARFRERCGAVNMDDEWRKQQILELEVYSKRLELVQEQIQLTLEQLRSGLKE